MFAVFYTKFCDWLEAAQEPIFIERAVVELGSGVRESAEDYKWDERDVNALICNGCDCLEEQHKEICQTRIYTGYSHRSECDPEGVETLAAATKRSPVVGTVRWSNRCCGFETKDDAYSRFCTDIGVMALAHLCEKQELLTTLTQLTPHMCKQFPETMAHMGQLLQLEPRGSYSATEMAALRKAATYLHMIVECTQANRVPGDTTRSMQQSEARYKSAVVKEKMATQSMACTLLRSIDGEIYKVAAGIVDVEKVIGQVSTSVDDVNTTLTMHEAKRARFREPR